MRSYGDRGGHGWSLFKGDELLSVMADHVLENSPGAKEHWIY